MTGHHHGSGRGGFVENSIQGLHAAMDRALYAEQNASAKGLLQRLDPRVKVAALAGFILVSAVTGKLWVVAAVLMVGTSMAALSRISLWTVATRVWLPTITFSGVLAIPAIFLTPAGFSLTASAQGLRTAGMLVLRAEAAATLALVLVFTTPWTHVLKALRMFRVPVVFVVILGMTCRYILLLLETAHEMFESRKSRTVGPMTRGEQRRVAILSAGALLSRTLQLSNEVYLAMQARGFRGEVFILDDFRMTNPDWMAVAASASLCVTLVWAGH